ncbi:MAG: filamentous hemagglutinin N-terminal domain-containing protein, partial [Alkalinema sp. RU_4_3]|nr:filamentous hemagglutinin N-terminal domain-containing protein [Alkalinema sp. RU_4_3]
MTSATSNGARRSEIEGGAIRGSNLFHSFLDLSIAPGESLYFQNPIGISNIISRVTGVNPSNIEGTLGVTGGNANLFLLNPNGILFGANARLDVNGSFIATTAPAIQFGTQGLFSTSTPEPPALLTVNPSAFLFKQMGIAAIVNRSRTPLASGGQGLQVPDGQSLLLLGGSVTLDGGGVNATEGRVELGAVSGAGTVGLSLVSNNLHLSFPDAIDRANVTLTNGATVNTSGEGSGPIQIWGRSIFVNGGAQITAFSQGDKAGGNLIVNASESLEVLRTVAFGNLSTLSFGDGKAGDLIIETQKLIVRDGAQIFAGTLGSNTGGQLSVSASESVEIGGRDPISETSSNLSSFTGSTGQAGNLTINTKKLIIRDGGALSAEALSVSGQGRSLPVSGEGGNLTVNASDIVDLRGGFIFTATQGPGNAGNISINTGRLLVQDKSEIGAASEGSGNAGTITVQARSITLTNRSNISATTKSSQGGNIALQVQDFLLLRQGSTISTTAGTAQAGGDGGNITFKGNFILAIPKENSNISANAFTGRGGNIRIMAQNLLGIQYRPQLTPLSDITVSSTFGSAGSTTIDTPNIDPSRGLLIPSPNPHRRHPPIPPRLLRHPQKRQPIRDHRPRRLPPHTQRSPPPRRHPSRTCHHIPKRWSKPFGQQATTDRRSSPHPKTHRPNPTRPTPPRSPSHRNHPRWYR